MAVLAVAVCCQHVASDLSLLLKRPLPGFLLLPAQPAGGRPKLNVPTISPVGGTSEQGETGLPGV